MLLHQSLFWFLSGDLQRFKLSLNCLHYSHRYRQETATEGGNKEVIFELCDQKANLKESCNIAADPPLELQNKRRKPSVERHRRS